VTPEGDRRVASGAYRVSVGSGQPGTGAPSQSAPFSVDTTVALAK
jgi:beta-glucosidase